MDDQTQLPPVANGDAPAEKATPEQEFAWFKKHLAEYRKLKAQVSDLETRMEGLKALLRPTVEAMGGSYQDPLGYARVNEKAPAVSFKSADVEKLYQSWIVSGDPIMKSCGSMLGQARAMSAGSTYLQIK